MLALFQPDNEEAARALFDAAVETVDEYLTPGAEDSIYQEPVYQNTFNNDLNRFLKSEKLGKHMEATPRLHDLLAVNKRTLARGVGGGPSPRDMIQAAISGRTSGEGA